MVQVISNFAQSKMFEPTQTIVASLFLAVIFSNIFGLLLFIICFYVLRKGVVFRKLSKSWEKEITKKKSDETEEDFAAIAAATSEKENGFKTDNKN